MLFDSHAHLNNGELTEEERQAWVRAIEESPLDYVMNVGFDPASSLLAAEQAEKYPWCYAAAGCHPHDTKDMDEAKLQMIREIAGRDKVMAIGEIGLDYHYDLSNRDVQREWFRRQIRLANELKMPIAIHAREADQEVMDILKEEGAFSDERKSWFPKRPDPEGYVTGRPAVCKENHGKSGYSCGDAVSCKDCGNSDAGFADGKSALPADTDSERDPASFTGKSCIADGAFGSNGGTDTDTTGSKAAASSSIALDCGAPEHTGENAESNVSMCDDARVLLHCFSGSAELGKQYVRMGATISVAGPVTYKNNRKTAAMVSEIPLSFLLVETDSPYLTPAPFRGRPNMPPYVEHTAAKIAEIKGISFETVAEQTKRNAMRFYGIK